MEIRDFFGLMKRKKGTIVSIVIIFLALATAIIFVQPLKYEAQSKILVVQDFGGNVDPYLASKSNEYLSNILANVTTSDYFFRDVMSAGFNIDQNYFPERADKRIEMWGRTVGAKTVGDTGIIKISIFHPDKYQLEQIARAVNYVLKTKNGQYHGGGDKVSVRIIDEPILSNWPTKPNVLLDYPIAFVLGFLFSLVFIYLFPEEEYDVRFWPSFKKKENIIYTSPKESEEEWRSVSDVLKHAQDKYHRQSENNAPAAENEYRGQMGGVSEYEERHSHANHNHNEIKGHGSMKNILN